MNGNSGERTQILSADEIESELKFHGLEIVRLISDKGGMADVYEAWQPSVQRRIAAKRIKSHLVANPDVQARFEEEALLLGRLNHPNIVQVIDYCNEKLTLYMEFIEGRALDEILADVGRLSREESLRVISSVLDALAYAHARNIIHRDVKPGNIFITDEGLVKLGDFGIAAIIGDEVRVADSQGESFAGTPSYIAPEQLTTDIPDGRTDIYAAGVTLYLLLTGRLPFVGDNSASTAAMRLTHDPVPPSRLDRTISPELERVVLKALARSRDDRFQTALEFKQAIEVLLLPRHDLACLAEAKSELQKSLQGTSAERKRILTSCVKLLQMTLAENPGNREAEELLADVHVRLSGIRRREYAIIAGLTAVIIGVMVSLVMQLSHGHGSLDLFTNEPAEIYLDGTRIGTSPFVFTTIPTGQHKLYIEQPGFYRSPERTVHIEKGKVVSVSEPIPDGGTIIVSSMVPGTAVLLDGTEIGRTPLTRKVVVGRHKLEVSGVQKDILVHANETGTFSFPGN
jgi:tRNA A-37 threonylcarbamoyl transferase component Bud32